MARVTACKRQAAENSPRRPTGRRPRPRRRRGDGAEICAAPFTKLAADTDFAPSLFRARSPERFSGGGFRGRRNSRGKSVGEARAPEIAAESRTDVRARGFPPRRSRGRDDAIGDQSRNCSVGIGTVGRQCDIPPLGGRIRRRSRIRSAHAHGGRGRGRKTRTGTGLGRDLRSGRLFDGYRLSSRTSPGSPTRTTLAMPRKRPVSTTPGILQIADSRLAGSAMGPKSVSRIQFWLSVMYG